MTDWYFYQERGQTQGPITLDELRARVRDGRLRAFDLIYKEGESSWKMAMEHADLRESFREAGQSVMKGRPWVCLRRKGSDSPDYVTDGPFSDDEVRTALSSGRLGYGDYLWRDGFADWRRVGAVEAFNPRAATTAPPVGRGADPDEVELLGSVVELKRAGPPPVELPPPESDGEDLVEVTPIGAEPPAPEGSNILGPRGVRRGDRAGGPPPAPNTKTSRTAKPDLGAPPTQTKSSPERTGTPPEARVVEPAAHAPQSSPGVSPAADPGPAAAPFIPRVKRRDEVRATQWTDWTIVAALVIALGAGFGIFVLKRAKRAAPTLPSVASVPAAAPAPVVPAVPANELPPTPPPSAAPAPEVTPPAPSNVARETPASPAPAAALELTVAVQTSGAGKARLDVRSNVAANVPIYVQVVAGPGQVADGAAYYRYLRVAATGAFDKPLDLSAIDPPPGHYRISVETRDQRKETTLNLGVGESRFRQAVGRQRKLAAGAIWQERLRLYGLTGQVTQALQKSGAGRALPARSFTNLDRVKKTTGEKFLFFEDWWELKQIVQSGRKLVTADLITRAKKIHERLATSSVWRPRPT